ncbi:S9 family peptidase [Hamadaea sp. NPDC050747]|uniref:S9 family peptidase n=1 Tax=Hamadaea sp. NPDC050747 TaxID=3155789 RepID=UPI003404450C
MSAYEDFRPIRRFYPALAFSPDGTQLAYIDDSLGQFNISVQRLAGGPSRSLSAFTDQTVRRVAWHPNGQSLLFQADARGTENAQLYEVELDGGRITQLTDEPSTRFGLATGDPFSPDGARFAYFANNGSQPGFDTLVSSHPAGMPFRAYDRGGRTYPASWSPDGSLLSAVQYHEGYDQIVYLIPAAGGEPRQLTPDKPSAVYEVGPWLPDGSGLIVRTDAGRDYLGLAILDAGDGHLTWLDTPDWDVEDVAMTPDGATLVWLVNVDGASELRIRSLATNDEVKAPRLPMGRARGLAVSPDGERLAVLLSTPSRPWDIAIIDLSACELIWLTDSRPDAQTVVNVEPELVQFPSFDGREISAYLYRPAASLGRVGVLVSIHGGPVAQERPVYDDLYQYLLSRGIAVLAPNVRGSSGYGKTFQHLVYRDWGGGDLQDIEAAAHFLQSQAWVAADRIGLIGGSYGGFMVLSAIARLPEINWAAAVDMFGPSDLITMAKATAPAFMPLVVELIGHPEDDADDLTRRSPITYADSIRTPLYVLQGANDIRVPQSGSDQLVERLRNRGVDVRYDIYPDEGHGFMRTANEIKAYSESAEFLVERLGSTVRS